MLTKKQAKTIKCWLEKTSSQLSQQFLFLLGGVKEIPRKSVNQILKMYDKLDAGFAFIEDPIVSKFVEYDDIVEFFIGAAIEHPSPAKFIDERFCECYEAVMPRVRLEMLYLSEDEDENFVEEKQ